MNIAIVTACPSGMTNSFIAAKLLEKAAQELNWTCQVECQSSLTGGSVLSAASIEQAQLVVIASDQDIDTTRFIGKPVSKLSIEEVIENPTTSLQQAKERAKVLTQDQAYQAPQAPSAGVLTSKNVVAITACPTGVAHTFMAAEALEEEGKKRGYKIKVETRGSVGAKNQLTAEEIAQADLVIIAADIEVPLERFDGKKLYRTKTGPALKKTAAEMDNAWEQASVYHHSGAKETSSSESKGVYQHLMTGVSHMLPVVVAGGLIIALSFVFGIEAFKEEGTLAAALMTIGGGSAFALMIPVLAGFIAFSIADRPGLAPGLIGGMLASTINAGFLGGIAAGFIAGYSAKALAQWIKLPVSMESLKPILIIPFVASLFTGLVMIYIVGSPVASIMAAMTEFLNSMGSTNAVLLGIILGAMMCFDLGGPVNKAAYTFGVGLLASQQYLPMAAIMAAGMVPALGMGLATFMAKKKFDKSEQEAGKASFVLGLCFISEGAIPFAAKDPMRVIPACMLGGATTGALSMLIGAKLMAPHGGLFVLFIPGAISPAIMYLATIALGSVITAVTYSLLKVRGSASEADLASA
ncbi:MULTISPECIES: PTS fructose-like transporter subunit IIB [unclassified Vibrio]|uniref:protein-N(pi)-phosphohistidine--D-fructose phosphotransferase n=1 Tax=Vibrio sp. HB236076 TaxID=3232307 RepID=A0AB39HJ69_9VIBR|nr:PTS fructose-like transporter subunit IIB [Vibrio sp. HB161653]MDP5253052.1 PTS fructose-like transporter subunit IIB [Vibrio sp. HB161653]